MKQLSDKDRVKFTKAWTRLMGRMVDASCKVSMFMQTISQSVERVTIVSAELENRAEAHVLELLPEAISKLEPVKEVIKQSGIAFSFSKGLERTMKAAAIVLIHSQIDIHLTELISLSVDCDREGWKDRVIRNDKSQFGLSALLKHDPDAVMDEAFSAYLSNIGKMSLVNRSKLLMSQIPPQSQVEPLLVIAKLASNETIKLFDDARHRIVHVEPFSDEIDDQVIAACGAMISHILYLLLNVSAYYGLDYSLIDLARFTGTTLRDA